MHSSGTKSIAALMGDTSSISGPEVADAARQEIETNDYLRIARVALKINPRPLSRRVSEDKLTWRAREENGAIDPLGEVQPCRP
jgi:hypothetical protein